MKISIVPEIIDLQSQLKNKLLKDNYSEFEKIMIIIKLCLSQSNEFIDIKRLFYLLLRKANIKISVVEERDDLAFIDINDDKYNIYGIYGFNLTNAKIYEKEINKQLKEKNQTSEFCYPLTEIFLSQSELKIKNNKILSPSKIEILTFRNCLCNINKIEKNYTNIKRLNDKIFGITISLNLFYNIRKESLPNQKSEISNQEIIKRLAPGHQINYEPHTIPQYKITHTPPKSSYTKKKHKYVKKK